MFFKRNKKIPLKELFSNGFVDIHSHILPGIDDGAKTLEDSINLIEKMHSLGIHKLITTPHVLGDVYPNSTELILSKLTEVQNELKNRGLNKISLATAAEYMLDEQFMNRLNNKDLLPIKDNMILVEMSYFNPPINLYDMLFKIQLKGYKPILAHPERYAFYHHNINEFYKLKKAGCLFQLNILSLTHQYGKEVKKIATHLLEKNLYDFLGTDTHHQNHLKLMDSLITYNEKAMITDLMANHNNLFS